MMENGRIYTEQLNIRLRPSEKKALDEWAEQQGKTLGELGRETLLNAVRVSPEERRRLAFVAFGNEINRLTIVALQAQEDVSSEEVRIQIERQARASAWPTLDLWLSVLTRKEVT